MEPVGKRKRYHSLAERKALVMRTQGLSAQQAADQGAVSRSTIIRWRQEYQVQNASTSKPQESATKADAPTESILPDGRELRSRGTAEEGEEKSIEPLQMTTSTGGIGIGMVRRDRSQQQRLVAAYHGATEDTYVPLREGSLGLPAVNRMPLSTAEFSNGKGGNVWVKAVGADQPRELLPIFQRLGKTPDGRNYPLAVADHVANPFQVNIERWPVPCPTGHYNAPRSIERLTPALAGRAAYLFVLHHEQCFKKALGPKWGAGVRFLDPEQQKQANRLPRLSDPEVVCNFLVPPFELLAKGSSAVSVTALGIVQAMCGINLRQDVATTGSLDLHGNVMAVSSIRNKMVSAYNHGIPTLALPWLSLEALNERQEWIRAEREKSPQRFRAEVLPDEVVSNVELKPLHTMVDLLRLAAPELGLPADFKLYAGPGLTQCRTLLCGKKEGGIAWVEVATMPPKNRFQGEIEYHGEFNEKSIVETPHMFQAATTFARGALRRWQQLTGLPIKVDLFTQVDKATGRIVDLMFCFNALNGTVVYSNAYATGLVMAVLALAVGRHLPDTLAFGNGMDLGCLVYEQAGMGEVEVRVAQRAGIKTLILHTDNAQQVRAAAVAQGADLEVLGVTNLEGIMLLVKDMLIIPQGGEGGGPPGW